MKRRRSRLSPSGTPAAEPRCPKCKAVFETAQFRGVDFQRCTSCHGLWFRILGVERMKSVEGSEAIDIGDPELGTRFGVTDRVECPECHVPMIRLVDSVRRHVRFLSCKVCYGVFLEAGEFRELKHRSVTAFFRNWLPGARSLYERVRDDRGMRSR